MNERCPNCKGKGVIPENKKFRPLTFIVPGELAEPITKEIERLNKLLDTQTANPAVRRGLALYWMSINSSQTPAESLE